MEERLHENLRPQLCRLTAPPSVGWWRRGGETGYIENNNIKQLHFFFTFLFLKKKAPTRSVCKWLKAAMWRAGGCERAEDLCADLQTRKTLLDAGFFSLLIKMSRFSPRIYFSLSSYTCTSDSLCLRGDMEGNRMGSGTTDLGMVWRDMTPICAQHPKNLRQHLTVKNLQMEIVRPPGSAKNYFSRAV